MPTGWFQKKETPGDSADPKARAAAVGGLVRPAKGARVSQILMEDSILIASPGPDKRQVLESLVNRLSEKAGLSDSRGILAKVLDREQGISTTLDTGLGLPHVRLDGLTNIVAAMAIVPHGLADPKQPDLTIRAMFLFFSPNKQEFFPMHLQLLRAVSSLFQPALIDQLVHAATPGQALELIKKLEA